MTRQNLANVNFQGHGYGPGNYQADSPQARGLLDWNFPITHCHNGFGLANGIIYLMKMTAWTGGTVTNIQFAQNTKQGTAVTSQCWAGIYDASGNRLAQTNDLAATFNGATAPGFFTAPLSATYAMTQGTTYWMALLYNQTGGIGQTNFFATSLGNTYSIMNANTTGYNSMCSSYGTGQTTLPSTITTGSASPSGGVMYWVGTS